MQMSWLGQQKMEEVNRKDRTNMNYIKSRNNQGVRQTVYVGRDFYSVQMFCVSVGCRAHRKTINRLMGSVCLMLCLWLLAIWHQAWVDGGWRGAHLWGCDDVIERPAGGHERGVWRHYGDWPGELTPCLSRPVRLKGQSAIFFIFILLQCLDFVSSQPPSRNRRERAELRPDFFDSAAMIEDESVSKTKISAQWRF